MYKHLAVGLLSFLTVRAVCRVRSIVSCMIAVLGASTPRYGTLTFVTPLKLNFMPVNNLIDRTTRHVPERIRRFFVTSHNCNLPYDRSVMYALNGCLRLPSPKLLHEQFSRRRRYNRIELYRGQIILLKKCSEVYDVTAVHGNSNSN